VVAAKLRASIEALCDKLKDNPNVAENMAKVTSERQGLQGLLTKSLEELLAARKIPCVTEAVMVEHYRRTEIKEVVDREKTAARAVATLRMELKDEQEDHDQVLPAFPQLCLIAMVICTIWAWLKVPPRTTPFHWCGCLAPLTSFANWWLYKETASGVPPTPFRAAAETPRRALTMITCGAQNQSESRNWFPMS
jgi:hypothetical protein